MLIWLNGLFITNLIFAVYQSHKFGHAISVIVRRAKSVFLHRPSRRKYNKICDCSPVFLRLTRKNGEYGRVLKMSPFSFIQLLEKLIIYLL